MSQVTDEHIDRLIHLVVEGRDTDEQREELADAMRASPSAKRRYVEYMQMHAMLQWEHSAAPGDVIERSREQGPQVRLRRWAVVAVVTAPLCASLLLLVLFWPTEKSSSEAITPLASVKSTGAARWAGGEDEIQSGESLAAGEHHLVAGVLELQFNNGVSMVLESPVRFEIRSDMNITLKSGRMVARVPPRAIGFTIETARANVVDLGTEFGVAIGPDDETLVQVFDGEVVTHWKPQDNGEGNQRSLQAGSAIRIEQTAEGNRLRELTFAEDRFVRHLPELGHDAYEWLPPYNTSQFDELHIVPAPTDVSIDGDLRDWDRSGAFASHLQEPFHDSYFVEGQMMYDEDYVYIGAHIGDPAPMRNVISPELEPELYWRGGALQVRLTTDPDLGWPVAARSAISRDRNHPDAGQRPQDVSRKIVHLTMWYLRSESRPCLAIQYGMNFQPFATPADGWQGAYQQDDNGLGYTLEYAIPWELLGAAQRPPQPGDDLAVCWQVHFSDNGGRIWRGHLVELKRPRVEGLAFLRADTWGRAIYHAEGNLPAATVRPAIDEDESVIEDE